MQKIYDLDVLKIQSKEVPGLENAVSREGFLQTLPCFWEKLGGIDGFFVARFIKTK